MGDISSARIPAKTTQNPANIWAPSNDPVLSVIFPTTNAIINVPSPFNAVLIPTPLISWDSFPSTFNRSPSVTKESPPNPP